METVCSPSLFTLKMAEQSQFNAELDLHLRDVFKRLLKLNLSLNFT